MDEDSQFNVRFNSFATECQEMADDLGLEEQFRCDAKRLVQRAAAAHQDRDRAEALSEMQRFLEFHRARITREGAEPGKR